MKSVRQRILDNKELCADIIAMTQTPTFRMYMDCLEELGQPSLPPRATPETIIQFSALEHWRGVGRAECIKQARNPEHLFPAEGTEEKLLTTEHPDDYFNPEDSPTMRRAAALGVTPVKSEQR